MLWPLGSTLFDIRCILCSKVVNALERYYIVNIEVELCDIDSFLFNTVKQF